MAHCLDTQSAIMQPSCFLCFFLTNAISLCIVHADSVIGRNPQHVSMTDAQSLVLFLDRYLFRLRIVLLINRNLHGLDKRYPVAIGPRLCQFKADAMMCAVLALRRGIRAIQTRKTSSCILAACPIFAVCLAQLQMVLGDTSRTTAIDLIVMRNRLPCRNIRPLCGLFFLAAFFKDLVCLFSSCFLLFSPGPIIWLDFFPPTAERYRATCGP